MSAPTDARPAAPGTRALGRPLAVVALCAAVLALLGAGVRADTGPLLDLDTRVSEALYAGDDRPAALTVLLEVLTAPGLSLVRYVLAVPVLIWLVRRRAWRTVLWVVVAAVFVRHVTSALKESFGRVRPAFEDGGADYGSLSFPSGHSSGIATLVTVGLVLAWPLLAPGARRLWAVLGVLAVLLVGLTRMWLGVHYLSDVLAGWALGVGWTVLTAVVLGVLPLRGRELR
ncbi:undecaprenyl-diphosphatase [Blastococcus aurantiacus]|uniref:Undecaprenyl-diphosphatase n=1 Tax=Blastococcus aurantiacus TaxID=1550231 RepID=A0A1G7LR01_9ACTN|nr:phosphatase PAP2 family protein [Blastococcus aurantiacus]SDF51816.1 undecaprenyl-diphosphatase [Blastococcus aurantiacus]